MVDDSTATYIVEIQRCLEDFKQVAAQLAGGIVDPGRLQAMFGQFAALQLFIHPLERIRPIEPRIRSRVKEVLGPKCRHLG